MALQSRWETNLASEMAQGGYHPKRPKMQALLRELGVLPKDRDTGFYKRAKAYAEQAVAVAAVRDHNKEMRAQAKERQAREKPNS